MNGNLRDRLLAKVQHRDGCWIWTGCLLKGKGYGQIKIAGSTHYAHRVAYELFVGQIPPGYQVDHAVCFNHACVNPGHLRLATPKQNQENRLGAARHNRVGIRGVRLQPTGRYLASAVSNGRTYRAGTFDTAEEAAEAARLLRIELFTHNTKDRLEPI